MPPRSKMGLLGGFRSAAHLARGVRIALQHFLDLPVCMACRTFQVPGDQLSGAVATRSPLLRSQQSAQTGSNPMCHSASDGPSRPHNRIKPPDSRSNGTLG
ncbi:hypothetical protein FIBSPDRAFT_891775 [Athelia psychrophila]|uniref:Uncharacterized protein n=1 Tax=Athelia psychrophila TaxID=1759441 RepID=A0A166JB89_9AGAM|nr:hypothetical protein FIBSPDRAFT_902385 [Fibularhizoctonia sp. CBS 109695]KZP20687.1 hypothetical protein FIBSPDRAFT_891775 [Fibularhizoctonia sp. CBS 109695]